MGPHKPHFALGMAGVVSGPVCCRYGNRYLAADPRQYLRHTRTALWHNRALGHHRGLLARRYRDIMGYAPS